MTPDPLIGRTVGNYTLLQRIGKGGTSTVYRAQQTNLDREVAVKVMTPRLTNNQEFINRFQREAAIIAKLQHPFILPLHDYGHDQETGTLYIVTRLMKGGTLSRLLKQTGPMPLPAVNRILRQVGSALHYAHTHPAHFIHRDVNPRNILLDIHRTAYLSDFGLARPSAGQTITLMGDIGGTKEYMSPEQWSGEEIDSRTDIYALGITAYRLLSGELPFQSDEKRNLILKHLQDRPPSLLARLPDLPPAIEEVIFRAMAKNPGERYDSAKDMVEAFSAAANNRHASPVVSIPAVKQPRNWVHADDNETTMTTTRERFTLTLDMAGRDFDYEDFSEDLDQLMSTEGQYADIRLVSIDYGSVTLTLEMNRLAAAMLFNLLKQRPRILTNYRLTRAEYRGQILDLADTARKRRVAAPFVFSGMLGLTLLLIAFLFLVSPPAAPGIAAVAPTLALTDTPAITATATPDREASAKQTSVAMVSGVQTRRADDRVQNASTVRSFIAKRVQDSIRWATDLARVISTVMTPLNTLQPLPSPTGTASATLTITPTVVLTSTPTRTPTLTRTPRPTWTPPPPTQPNVVWPTSTPVPPPPNTPVPPPPNTPIPPLPTSTPQPVDQCGNNICDRGENAQQCPIDCVCGNGVCEPGEGPIKCPADCNNKN